MSVNQKAVEELLDNQDRLIHEIRQTISNIPTIQDMVAKVCRETGGMMIDDLREEVSQWPI